MICYSRAFCYILRSTLLLHQLRDVDTKRFPLHVQCPVCMKSGSFNARLASGTSLVCKHRRLLQVVLVISSFNVFLAPGTYLGCKHRRGLQAFPLISIFFQYTSCARNNSRAPIHLETSRFSWQEFVDINKIFRSALFPYLFSDGLHLLPKIKFGGR
jgi:hypothetical protein